MSSRIPGFYRLRLVERRRRLAQVTGLDADALAAFADAGAAQKFRAHASQRGMQVLALSVEADGALVEDDSP